jgi:heterodisulfide reductase subunit A-like polyferredoxin
MKVDKITGATNVPGIFVGGDNVRGPASVIEAIRDGKIAAVGIDAYLRGVSLEDAGTKKLESNYYYEGDDKPTDIGMLKLHKHQLQLNAEVAGTRKQENVARRILLALIPKHRRIGGELSVEERIQNFEEVELPLSEDGALEEAQRCLACRLCIGCGICAAVCPQDAIDYSQEDRIIEITSKEMISYPSVIESKIMPAMTYQYKNSYNCITASEFEAMMNPEGAYDGLVMRPYDGEVPKRVAFIFMKEEFGEFEGLSLIHLAKLMLFAKKQYPDIEFKLFSDTDKIGKLPSGYEHLGDGADILKALGENFKQIPDIVFEENDETKGFLLTYTNNDDKEEQVQSDLVVIASIFNITKSK